MRAYTRCHPLPLLLASTNFPFSSLFFSAVLSFLAPEAKKTVETAKMNSVFDNMFDGMLQGGSTVFNDLNQQKEKQMFIPFD